MASLDDIRSARLAKLKLLQEKGINPYPVSTLADATLKEASEDFTKLSEKRNITLAGRIMAQRSQGGLVFADLFDGTGKFQALLQKDCLAGDTFPLWADAVDIGDFVEVAGALFLTKRNEKTLAVKNWRMLAKSLRPLPEKWHGLQDVEERFRKRYLDTLMNPGLKDLFEKKAKFWDETRKFLKKENFLEVETPTIEVTTGGAEAKPFKTHHNDFDLDVYMRISVGELWQ